MFLILWGWKLRKVNDKFFSAKEIPNSELRLAVNCWLAEHKCDKRLSAKCKESMPNVWRKCPKQTGKEYTKEN